MEIALKTRILTHTTPDLILVMLIINTMKMTNVEWKPKIAVSKTANNMKAAKRKRQCIITTTTTTNEKKKIVLIIEHSIDESRVSNQKETSPRAPNAPIYIHNLK